MRTVEQLDEELIAIRTQRAIAQAAVLKLPNTCAAKPAPDATASVEELMEHHHFVLRRR